MKILYFLIVSFVIFLFISCGGSSLGKKIVSLSTTEEQKLTPIVIIGPSTVYIERYPDNKTPFYHYKDNSVCKLYGWGELLPEISKEPKSIYNFAQPGADANLFRVSPKDRKKSI